MRGKNKDREFYEQPVILLDGKNKWGKAEWFQFSFKRKSVNDAKLPQNKLFIFGPIYTVSFVGGLSLMVL